MSQKLSGAILFGLCCALAACDRSDPTEPEAVTSKAADSSTQSMSLLVSDTWSTKRLLWPWRWLMAAATINGKIYVVGGRGRGSNFRRMDVYNVATDTWSQAASVPSTINWGGGAPNGASVINGKLYVTGGLDRYGKPSRILLVYNPATKTWARKADMPQASCEWRGFHWPGEQGVINGQLYVYTGCYAATASKRFFRYSPATNMWFTLKAPPDHRGAAAGTINGKFYLVGGHRLISGTTFEQNVSQMDVYNPATNSWTTKAGIVATATAAAVLNGKLFVAGGSRFGELQNTLRVFDPMTNTWTRKADMPKRHMNGAAAAAGSRLFVIWGHEELDPNPAPSRVYAYTP